MRPAGLAAFRSHLKMLAPGRAFAPLTRKSALFCLCGSAALSSSPAKPLKKLRPAGLEPAAYWFEASRSIQLSYGRKKRSKIVPEWI